MPRWQAILPFLLVYLVVYLFLDGLAFPLRKDELHFWPTSLYFAQTFPPSLESLRSYNDLSTPLPFVTYGALEQLFGRGVWMARATNLLLSFAVLMTILFAAGRATSVSLRCALALLACPYFLGVATHVYTDQFAIALSLFGVALTLKRHWGWSAVCFVLAISSRQYAVAFPAAMAGWAAYDSGARKRYWEEKVTWLVPGLASLALVGWILFFGGPGPRTALNSQFVATSSWLSLLPQNAGYFLACVGLYFVTFEAILFGEDRFQLGKALGDRRRLAVILVLTIGYFSLFPPVQNPDDYPFKEMGYLDKGLRYFASDFARVAILCGFATLAVIRFSEPTLAATFVLVNAALMIKAHIAWDKYALPLLAVLWWMKAGGYLSRYVSSHSSGVAATRASKL